MHAWEKWHTSPSFSLETVLEILALMRMQMFENSKWKHLCRQEDCWCPVYTIILPCMICTSRILFCPDILVIWAYLNFAYKNKKKKEIQILDKSDKFFSKDSLAVDILSVYISDKTCKHLTGEKIKKEKGKS